MLKTVIIRDLLFYCRHQSETFLPILFFIMMCALFAIAFPLGAQRLSSMAPVIVWLVALLSMMLSLDSSYRSDFQEGTLEQILVSQHSLSVIVLGKALAHWIVIGLPLTLIAPLLACLLQVNMAGIVGVGLTFLIGIPALSLLGTLGVALTLGLPRGGIFLSILMLPLLLPILLIGINGVYAASLGLNGSGQMALLAAILMLSVCFVPWGVGTILRLSVQTG